MSFKERNRRKFLADAMKSLGLLGISPVLSNFIVQSLSSVGSAADLGSIVASDKIYIFFSIPGGPPRWLFDLPLTPNGTATAYTDAFSHTGLGTFVGIGGSNDAQAVYKPWYDVNSKYWLPPVWGCNPAGGAFTNCLSNAAFIRGVDFEIDNHTLGRYRNQSPIIGGLSIAGVLAQKTSSAFPAISSGSISAAFKAENALSPSELNLTVTNTVNPVSTIMSYFVGRAPASDLAVKQALTEFDKYATKNYFNQNDLIDSKNRSEALISVGVKSFTDKWPSTYAKYLTKVQEAFTNVNTGKIIDNVAIPSPPEISAGVPDPRTSRSDSSFLGPMADLRTMINNNTSVSNLAATFATVEILITMGLTQVLTADIGSLTKLVFNDTGGLMTLDNDQHFIGSLVATIGTNFYYRAILNCTEELVSALKAKNLFDKTLIQFGSEFSRNPRANGSGSDHGFKGSSVLLISGMIAKTTVVGNIKSDTSPNYLGTWGLAANHPLNDNKYPFRINDIAKTVCGMLGVRDVVNNGVYILKNNGTQWESFGVLGEAKNV